MDRSVSKKVRGQGSEVRGSSHLLPLTPHLAKAALLGGTFNPIHFGHLEAVAQVRKQFALDRIYLIPSAIPPHKPPQGIADAQDRLEMTRLAVSEYPIIKDCVTVSDIEIRRSGPSYTIDTVYHFKAILPDTELFFIAGLDAFLETHSWKSCMKLFQEISFIVMPRAGYAGDRSRDARPCVSTVKTYLHACISEGYRFQDGIAEPRFGAGCYIHSEMQPVYISSVCLPDISSTEIRRRIKAGQPVQQMIPEPVENFIKTKGLFNDV